MISNASALLLTIIVLISCGLFIDQFQVKRTNSAKKKGWLRKLESQSLRWDIHSNEFDTCPKNKHFVDASTMTFYYSTGQDEVAHSIVIEAVKNNDTPDDCQSSVCLGNGSLNIYVDGNLIIKPGDYSLINVGGRIIAYNTHLACARKKDEPSSTGSGLRSHRKLYEAPLVLQRMRTPVDFVSHVHGEMTDSTICKEWIDDRSKYDDIFKQGGNLSIVHVQTPLISFHIEYRYSPDNNCEFSPLETWITDASEEIFDSY